MDENEKEFLQQEMKKLIPDKKDQAKFESLLDKLFKVTILEGYLSTLHEELYLDLKDLRTDINDWIDQQEAEEN